MASRIASHRMASMRPRLEERRAPAVTRHAGDAPSPTMLVAKVLAGALLVFAGLTFVALAPPTIATLVALAGISGALALIRRRRYVGPDARADRQSRWRRAATGWGTVAVSSVALLVLALVVPEGYDVLFAALGLTGMVVVRLGMKPINLQATGHGRGSASDRPSSRRWRRAPALAERATAPWPTTANGVTHGGRNAMCQTPIQTRLMA